MAQPNFKGYTENLLFVGRNEISFFLSCLDNYRLIEHQNKSKAKFLREVLNKDRMRISYDVYLKYLHNKHRPTDKRSLPNFFFFVNVLEPLNISLYTLYTIYAPKP